MKNTFCYSYCCGLYGFTSLNLVSLFCYFVVDVFFFSLNNLIKLAKNCHKCFYELQLIKIYNIHKLIKNLKSTNDKVFIRVQFFPLSTFCCPTLAICNFHKFSPVFVEFCNIVVRAENGKLIKINSP